MNTILVNRIGRRPDLIPHQPWRNHANCIGTDPDMFFAGRGVGWATIWNNVQHLCTPCPVRTECQQYGRTQDDGMYGGVARDAGRTVIYKPLPGCGTLSGYRRHMGRNEAPCGPCRRAKREDMRARRKAKGERR